LGARKDNRKESENKTRTKENKRIKLQEPGEAQQHYPHNQKTKRKSEFPEIKNHNGKDCINGKLKISL